MKLAILPAATTEDAAPNGEANSKARAAAAKPNAAKGAAAAALEPEISGRADEGAFAVHPETWEIPPYEHRYVTTHFRPTEMRSYRCRFQAVVVDNDDPSTGRQGGTEWVKKLSHLRGWVLRRKKKNEAFPRFIHARVSRFRSSV